MTISSESFLEIARRLKGFCWNPFKRTPKYFGTFPVVLFLFGDRTAILTVNLRRFLAAYREKS